MLLFIKEILTTLGEIKSINMKNSFLPLLLVIMTSFTILSCSKDEGSGNALPTVPVTQLTEAEINGLKFMREEEKLARDVYSYFIDLYGTQIFVNITSSEQKHMDSVLSVMITYGVEDPALPEMGKFHDTTLQRLYGELTVQGANSLLDAYKIGALIEELDIYDLNRISAETNRADILTMYEFLTCGSRNHLRSFNMQVVKEGGSYDAKHLTQQEYNDIANSAKEKCGNL